MIILLSAVGSTGKTLMAQKLLERYHIPYLSIDHLKMGLYRGSDECGFTPLDDTRVIADRLWPILKGIIRTNIENRQHIILEGAYLLPHYLQDFDSRYAKGIIPVFFGFSTSYIRQNFHDGIVKYRNKIEHRISPEERTVEELIREHQEFREQCLQAGVKYFEIENDYAKEILQVYDYIDTKIRGINMI